MRSRGSFTSDYLRRQVIPASLLQTFRELGEYKGKQTLFISQSPQTLETLRETSVIQSIESSNRIEGVVAPPQRLKKLAADKTAPENRSEQEIAGYREVLRTIHSSWEHIPFTPEVVLQFHRDLYRYFPGDRGGSWKSTDNVIEETDERTGETRVRFTPVPAHQTADAMQELHRRFHRLRDAGEIDPLLLIPAYVLDFLCIHPFADGNGRMARLLTLLLLYQEGYEVGRYISIERIVERTKEGYYDSLYKSSQHWHDAKHSLEPWLSYFLGVMLLTAYQKFEKRVGVVERTRGTKSDTVRDIILRLPTHFRFADIEQATPGISRPTINRVLKMMKDEGLVRCIKSGRNALWKRET